MLKRGISRSALLVVLLVSCRKPAPDRPLRIAYEGDAVTSLDPVVATDAFHFAILSNSYEGLVSFNQDMRLEPALAESWGNLDERTWILRLRRARFHDGAALTARDVQWSLERSREHPGLKRYVATIKNLEILSEDTIRLTTSDPDPLLMNRLAHAPIVRQPLDGRDPSIPVGTGPYRPFSLHSGVVDTEAFAEYWGSKARVLRVSFVPQSQGASPLEERADLWRVNEPGARNLRPGRRVVSTPSVGGIYLWFNAQPTDKNPFADPRVREAVSLSIDRPRLCRRVSSGAVPLHQLIPRGIFGHVADVPDRRFDPENAKRLLKEGGYEAGFDVPLTYAEGGSITPDVVGELQTYLADVGIRASVKKISWSSLVENWRAGRLRFFLCGWLFDTGEGQSLFVDCLKSRDAKGAFGAYNPGYSSARLDRLIEEQSATLRRTERANLYRSLTLVTIEETPLVPLFTPMLSYSVPADLVWKPRLDGKVAAVEMSWSPD